MKKEDLIDLCRRNDRSAQTRLFHLHYPVILGVIGRYFRDEDTAKDILQEVFVKIFSKIDGLKETKNFDAWARSIAVHQCLDQLRKSKNIFFTGLDENMPWKCEEEEDMEIAFHDVTAEDVYAVMDQLPAGYRTVFNLYAVDQLSHKEIAIQLNISESTSKTQYFKARKAIRSLLLKKKVTHAG